MTNLPERYALARRGLPLAMPSRAVLRGKWLPPILRNRPIPAAGPSGNIPAPDNAEPGPDEQSLHAMATALPLEQGMAHPYERQSASMVQAEPLTPIPARGAGLQTALPISVFHPNAQAPKLTVPSDTGADPRESPNTRSPIPPATQESGGHRNLPELNAPASFSGPAITTAEPHVPGPMRIAPAFRMAQRAIDARAQTTLRSLDVQTAAAFSAALKPAAEELVPVESTPEVFKSPAAATGRQSPPPADTQGESLETGALEPWTGVTSRQKQRVSQVVLSALSPAVIQLDAMGAPRPDAKARLTEEPADWASLLAPGVKTVPEVQIDRLTVTVQSPSLPTPTPVPASVPGPSGPPSRATRVFRNPWASYNVRGD